MNPLDYLIIIIMIYLIIRGILRGFIREIFSFAGVVLGIWLGNLYQPQITNFLKPYLPLNQYLPFISFGALFIAILSFCNILGWTIKLLFKKVLLGWMDSRALGACLGLLKGIIITYLAIVILTFYLPPNTPLIAGSKLAPWVIRSYQSGISLISAEQYKEWKARIEEEKKKISEIIPEKIKEIVNKP